MKGNTVKTLLYGTINPFAMKKHLIKADTIANRSYETGLFVHIQALFITVWFVFTVNYRQKEVR